MSNVSKDLQTLNNVYKLILENLNMDYKQQIAEMATKLGVDASVVSEISVLVEAAIAKGVEAKEAEIKTQVETAAKEAAQQVVEARIAMEAEMKSQAELLAEQFVEENKQRFVQTEKYDAMVRVFEQIKEAFSGIVLDDNSRETIAQLSEEINTLKEQNAQLLEAAETAECVTILSTKLNESKLTDVQKDRVKSLLEFTSPENPAQFGAIVTRLIEEVEDKEDKDDNKEDKESSKDGDDKGKEGKEDKIDEAKQQVLKIFG